MSFCSLVIIESLNRNPSEATAFGIGNINNFNCVVYTSFACLVIPFDLGVHSYIDHLDGRPRLASPHGWAASMFLVNACKHNKVAKPSMYERDGIFLIYLFTESLLEK